MNEANKPISGGAAEMPRRSAVDQPARSIKSPDDYRADKYPGNPLEPNPKLMAQVAAAVNGAEPTEAVKAWAKAVSEQFPDLASS